MVFNSIEWIVGIGALRHICSNSSLFQEYQKVANGIGNSSITKTLGKGKISLKLLKKFCGCKMCRNLISNFIFLDS